MQSKLRRFWIPPLRLQCKGLSLYPLIFCAVLICACIWTAGSYLLEIEDHYANVILAGGFGQYDAIVANIHPWLGGLVTLAYSLIPSVNWFGLLLLLVLFASGGAMVSLAARRRNGLLPALIVLSPIMILLACSPQSRVLSALAQIAGALCVISGARDGKQGVVRTVFGALLLLIGVALYMSYLSLVYAAAVLIISHVRKHTSYLIPRTSYLTAVPIIIFAIAIPTLTALLNPVWHEFHINQQAYERAADGNFALETQDLLDKYGNTISDEGEIAEPEQTAAEISAEEAIAAGTLGKAGFTLIDADLFVRRSAVDAKLLDPAKVALINSNAQMLKLEGFAERASQTLRKPQFLMLIALLLFIALVLEITNRGAGWLIVLSVAFAAGGHAVQLLANHTAFRDIAPFYILGILAMMCEFDGSVATDNIKNIVKSQTLRRIILGVTSVAFLSGIVVLVYMMRSYNFAQSPSVAANEELLATLAAAPDTVFIGDNPLDRFNPSALEAPSFGAYKNLIAGSYDAYSPRFTDTMARFNMTNPLPDSVDRLDVVYIDMSFFTLQVISARLSEEYNIDMVTQTPSIAQASLPSGSVHRMQLYWLRNAADE
ncbi:MAG: hypothetical protein LBD16_04520 [Oscillospiraceae bacterium]|jgi:hypothetical protein|nr:hypothetical protein [Oscillospiraceae bacterium]